MQIRPPFDILPNSTENHEWPEPAKVTSSITEFLDTQLIRYALDKIVRGQNSFAAPVQSVTLPA